MKEKQKILAKNNNMNMKDKLKKHKYERQIIQN